MGHTNGQGRWSQIDGTIGRPTPLSQDIARRVDEWRVNSRGAGVTFGPALRQEPARTLALGPDEALRDSADHDRHHDTGRPTHEHGHHRGHVEHAAVFGAKF